MEPAIDSHGKIPENLFQNVTRLLTGFSAIYSNLAESLAPLKTDTTLADTHSIDYIYALEIVWPSCLGAQGYFSRT